MSYSGNSPKVNRLRLQPRSADPVNPAEGDLQFADGSARAQGLWVYKSGQWTQASSAAQGSKNYLSSYLNNPGNGDFESNSTAGWSLFNTTLTGQLPTGSISAGAASITTFDVVNSGQLAGSASLRIAASTSLSAGQGFISSPFTIDREDQSKVLSFKFSYKLNAGGSVANFSGTSSNTFAIYIYDTTASAWIQPAGVYNMVQNSGVGVATGTFQTTSASTQYRIAVVCVNAHAAAITMLFDSFVVGPQIVQMAPAISDFTAYTPVITSGSGGPTNYTATGMQKIVGDVMQIHGQMLFSGASAAFSQVIVSLPSGRSIDTAKLLANSVKKLGYGYAADAATNFYGADVRYNSTTTVLVDALPVISGYSGTGPISEVAPFTYGAGDSISWYFEVPIAGLSSNSVSSADTDTRLVAVVAKIASGVTSDASTPVVFATKVQDTHVAYNATTGQFTAPISGDYEIGTSIALTSGAQNLCVYKNSVINAILGTPSATSFGGGSAIVPCVAGDVLDVRLASGSATINSSVEQTLSIKRLSGPAVIAASESINARYINTAGTAFAGGGTVPFATVDFDSHGAVSGGAFSAPISGKYEVNAKVDFQAVAYASTDYMFLAVYKNGVAHSFGPTNSIRAAGTFIAGCGVSATVNCVAGDLIDIRVVNTVAASALSTTSGENYFEVTRVGN